MANQTGGFGLRSTYTLGSTPATQGLSEFPMITAPGIGTYQNDPVQKQGTGGDDGYLQDSAAGTMDDGVAGGTDWVNNASTQQALLGVFNGAFYVDNTTKKPTWAKYYPADVNASDIEAYVFDDPFTVFEGQHDGTGTEAMNFGGFDLAGVSGSTKTGRSTQEIGTSTLATTGTWKQIGISKDPSNSDTSTANVNAYVVPSQDLHFYLQAATLA